MPFHQKCYLAGSACSYQTIAQIIMSAMFLHIALYTSDVCKAPIKDARAVLEREKMRVNCLVQLLRHTLCPLNSGSRGKT